MKPRYVIGLDLGSPAEPTGLAVVEYTPGRADQGSAVALLKRFVPGTAFGTIAAATAGVLKANDLGTPAVVCDVTAVGPTLVPELRKAGLGWLVPVVLTNGLTAAKDGDVWRVPKRDLVTGLQVLFQKRLLAIARDLPEADELARELTAYRPTALAEPGAETADWRTRPNDDLVFAVGVACWWAGRNCGTGQIHLPDPDQARNYTLPEDLFTPLPKDLFR
jgi:hypothetical protein